MVRFGISCVTAALLLAGCGGGDGNTREYDGAESAARAVASGEDDVTLRTEDGEMRIRRDRNDAPLPGGLPAYPGAMRTGGYSATQSGEDGGSGEVVTFTTRDDPANVIAYYRERIEASGHEIAMEMNQGDIQSVSVLDEANQGGYSVTATRTGSVTQIMIAGGHSN